MTNPNDVALLFSGQCRTLEKCLDSIHRIFSKETDKFCHVNLDEDSHKVELLDPLSCVIETAPLFMPERKEYHTQKPREVQVQSMLKQLWGLKRTWEVYAQSKKKHKWIVRCRYDIEFVNDLEDFYGWDCDLIVQKHNNWFGYNDQFGIMRYEVAERYFMRLNLLDSYIDGGGIFHPERFLNATMESLNIQRTNLLHNLVCKNGIVKQPSRWANFLVIF